MSFRLKTILGVALIEAILLVVLVASSIEFLTDSNEQQLAKRAESTARLFAAMTKDAVIGDDLASLDSFVTEVLDSPGIAYARVLDREGRVLAAHGETPPLRPDPASDRRLADVDDAVFDATAPVSEADVVFGHVEVGFDTRPLEEVIAQANRDISGLALLTLLLVGLFSYALGTYLTRQLGTLKRGVERVEMGELGYQIPAAGKDELAFTAEAFNRMSEALATNEKRRDAIVSAAPDGIITMDEQGRITEFNPAAALIFRYTREHALGQELADLILPPAAQEEGLARYLARDAGTWLGRRVETSLRRSDGETFPAELAISSIEGDHGRPFFIVYVRDISERVRSARLKNEFISTVSHELRTPLTAIHGSLGLVAGQATGQLPPQAMELIENARRNSERLTHLINDLLDVEKIESGSMTFNLTSVELGALIEQSVEANRAYAARFGVVYRFTGERREVHVEADEERLMQVMANLLSNAAKFSPAGGEVEVGMTVNDGYVLVSVTDHGPGIPEDFRERIFERFSQADASDTRLHGGTGLGLSISKAIIERLHGRIGFDTCSGDGTTFWFELPRRLD